MRILNWNIDKGGRTAHTQAIIDASLATKPDIVVFPEYRKDRPEIGTRLESHGFCPHLPAGHFKTGNQVGVFSKNDLGFRTVYPQLPPQLEGLVAICQNDEFTVIGVFLPEKGKDDSSIFSFLKWVDEESLSLKSNPTILTGDFNYGVQAHSWNRGDLGEYKIISKRMKNSVWVDCSPPPNPADSYPRTYCRNKASRATEGQRWPKGSSRPDHFFVNNLISFENIRVLSGKISSSLSDHEPIVGDFSQQIGT